MEGCLPQEACPEVYKNQLFPLHTEVSVSQAVFISYPSYKELENTSKGKWMKTLALMMVARQCREDYYWPSFKQI